MYISINLLIVAYAFEEAEGNQTEYNNLCYLRGIMAEIASAQDSAEFKSSIVWNQNRPHILVVACSDGRLQRSLDDFLNSRLGIMDYDRLFAPGGPGALARSAEEPLRSNQYFNELQFLANIHGVERIVLVFHSAAPGGPEQSVCGDYRRLWPLFTAQQIAVKQEEDLHRVLKAIEQSFPTMQIYAYRAETLPDHHIQFVDLLEK